MRKRVTLGSPLNERDVIEAKRKFMRERTVGIIGVICSVFAILVLSVTGGLCLFADNCIALEKAFIPATWLLFVVIGFFLGARSRSLFEEADQ